VNFTVEGICDQSVSVMNEVARIAASCRDVEPVTGTHRVDFSFARPGETNLFLASHALEAVGFLFIFSPNQAEAEICGAVAPTYRRRGVFSRLVAEATAELCRRGTPELLWVVERGSASGTAFVASVNSVYEITEFEMRFGGALQAARMVVPEDRPAGWEFRPAGRADMEDLLAISAATFGDTAEEARSFLEHTLGVAHRELYVGEQDGRTAAMVSIGYFLDEAVINGLAVYPDWQGRGIGGRMLRCAVARALTHSAREISLEVAANNERALELYRRNGFEVTTAFSYFRMALG